MLFVLLGAVGIIGFALYAIWKATDEFPPGHPVRSAAVSLNVTVISAIIAFPIIVLFGLIGVFNKEFQVMTHYIVGIWVVVCVCAWLQTVLRIFCYYVVDERPARAPVYAAQHVPHYAPPAPAFTRAYAEPANADAARISGTAEPPPFCAAPPLPSGGARKSRG